MKWPLFKNKGHIKIWAVEVNFVSSGFVLRSTCTWGAYSNLQGRRAYCGGGLYMMDKWKCTEAYLIRNIYCLRQCIVAGGEARNSICSKSLLIPTSFCSIQPGSYSGFWHIRSEDEFCLLAFLTQLYLMHDDVELCGLLRTLRTSLKLEWLAYHK